MPLDNTAKLADIITALQTMEGINAKAELASVVGSPSNADDTMATINSVIQSAKNTLAAKMDDGSSGAEPLQGLVDKLTIGKKWASGSLSIPKGSSRVVTGLTFNPIIIVTYSGDLIGFTGYTAVNGRWIGDNFQGAPKVNSAPILINSFYSFTITTDSYLPNTSVNWIAFE